MDLWIRKPARGGVLVYGGRSDKGLVRSKISYNIKLKDFDKIAPSSDNLINKIYIRTFIIYLVVFIHDVSI